MFRNKRILLIATFFLFLFSACNLFSGGSGVNQDPTAVIETRAAQLVDSTVTAQAELANALSATLTAMAPGLSIVSTPAPGAPTVTVSVQTNCRSGPGSAYDILGILNVGETAEVVGRSIYNDNWIIKLPSNPTVTCWLWGQYATVTGDTAGLKAYNPPPVPTPKATATLTPPPASFDVAYVSIVNSGSGSYAIKFKITNTGSVTWESNSLSATDLVASVTTTNEWNIFPLHNDSGGGLISSTPNLAAGQVGYTTDPVSTNPAGHSFTATIRLCSQDNWAGTCLDKTINFTP